ncbi:MAG: Xaa-Pro peptidase family protein [Candidatus Caldarchaeum sp.]|nr:Xaa-Pro peptidase family protein [Candidatus Caldarchaeum sp.]
MSFYNVGEMGFPENTPLGKIDFDKMLREKIARAREKMREYGLSALVCVLDINVGYITNVPPIFPAGIAVGGNRYAVLPIDGEPVVFEECNTAFVLKQAMNNVRVEYSIPGSGGPHLASAEEAQHYLTREWASQIFSILREYGLGRERVGIDVNSPHLVEALRKSGLDVSPDGGKALLEARMIKTPEELECIRALASVIDGMFATLARSLRAGVTEKEVFAKCVAYAIEHGLTPYGGFIVSGPHTWPKDNSRPFSGRRIRPGEVVYADFFNFSLNGYKSCYYRTFVVGKAWKELKETNQRVYEWLKEAEKKVKPGSTTRDVVETWPDESELWSTKPPFIRTERDKLSTFWMNMGHGIGLGLYEPPFFWRPVALRWPQRIEPNMAIALETLDCTPDGKAGVRIEDMLIVTESGHEVISKWPAEEITEVPLY